MINKYDDFLDYLYSNQDIKYKEFHSKIIASNDLIGVRTPDLKRVAKTISRGDYNSFFEENKHKYYEENLVHGLVLGYLKLDFAEVVTYNWTAIIVGTIVSGVVGYLCIKYFLKFVGRFSLGIFGYYC